MEISNTIVERTPEGNVRPLFAPPTTPTPPRKVSTGTSYEARGLVEIEPDIEFGSSQPIQIRELVPELVSKTQRQQTYSRMATDAGVDVSLRIVKTPVLGANFYVDPYSDQPIDQEIAEFIHNNLTEGMSAPFLNSLEDILAFFEDGYSVVEKVYENREWTPKRTGANNRVYTMLRKLAVRPVSTLKDFEYDDNGGPVKVVQSAIQGDKTVKEVDLEIAKLMVFTWQRKGGDLTGKSILRTAYPHWYYKTHLYKIDAIQKERHGIGIPRGKLLPGYTKETERLMRVLLKNLRSNEEAFVLQTPNVEVDFLKPEGQMVNVMDSALHHNSMILLNVMAQFMVLGLEQSGGGRATAGTSADMLMKALKFVANYICDVVNMYLIPELVVFNFQTKNFPKLQARNIGETRDLQQFTAAISNLLSQEGITSDLEFENWLRNIVDAPTKKQAEWDAQQAAKAQEQAAKNKQDTPVAGSDRGERGGVKDTIKKGNIGKPSNASD